jgi:hypothetical protein
MLHPGIASELSKLESEDRRRDASERRAGRRAEHEWGPSAAGAAGLLTLVLVGPLATILALGAVVGIASFVMGFGRSRGVRAVGPEAADRWAAWRVVEPDAEYRRHAA